MPPRKEFRNQNDNVDDDIEIITADNENIIKKHPLLKPRTPRTNHITTKNNEQMLIDLTKITTKNKVCN